MIFCILCFDFFSILKLRSNERMNEFIKKQEYNYIKRCMGDLNSALRNCVDKNVVDAIRICCQDKILSHFNDLSDE